MNFSETGSLLSIEIGEIQSTGKKFPHELLQSAAQEIKNEGINWIPVLVVEVDSGYEVFYGNFAFEAAKLSGLEEVSCIVVPSNAKLITESKVEEHLNKLNKMTVKQLRDLAKTNNVQGRSKMKKPELIVQLMG
jgi:ParB-like chromosome segregation protein Spo0J